MCRGSSRFVTRLLHAALGLHCPGLRSVGFLSRTGGRLIAGSGGGLCSIRCGHSKVPRGGGVLSCGHCRGGGGLGFRQAVGHVGDALACGCRCLLCLGCLLRQRCHLLLGGGGSFLGASLHLRQASLELRHAGLRLSLPRAERLLRGVHLLLQRRDPRGRRVRSGLGVGLGGCEVCLRLVEAVLQAVHGDLRAVQVLLGVHQVELHPRRLVLRLGRLAGAGSGLGLRLRHPRLQAVPQLDFAVAVVAGGDQAAAPGVQRVVHLVQLVAPRGVLRFEQAHQRLALCQLAATRGALVGCLGGLRTRLHGGGIGCFGRGLCGCQLRLQGGDRVVAGGAAALGIGSSGSRGGCGGRSVRGTQLVLQLHARQLRRRQLLLQVRHLLVELLLGKLHRQQLAARPGRRGEGRRSRPRRTPATAGCRPSRVQQHLPAEG